MRSIKLPAAALAAAASLALPGAAASAALRHVRRDGVPAHGCRVTLEFTQRVITSTEPTAAVGYLACATKSEEEGQAVTLYQRAAGTSTYTADGTGTTEKEPNPGAYSIDVSSVTSNSVFYALAGGIRSALRPVKVVAEVKLEGPPEGVQFVTTSIAGRRHAPAIFKGSTSPLDKGALVVLQRQNAITGNRWLPIGFTRVGEGGSFTIYHNFVIPGPANIRVIVKATKYNVTSPSNILSYEISQVQNRIVKIESAANPISFGQSTSIKGTVVGASKGTPVTLLARKGEFGAFKAVSASTVTGEHGEYSFLPQSPATDMYYRVEGDGRYSAELFEGVKYVLSPVFEPSATPAVAGSTKLTFTGTVSPGVLGHLVYLEREGASHVGFHIIGIDQLKDEAGVYKYKIEYIPTVPGTYKLEVKVPGDPDNAPTESEPLTVTVNPGPAWLLKPQTPVTLPEGQV
ncbi:MAG TPA: hypothetical protein VMF09_16465 [Solirubrobacteraceae bacterium]|nr:hypothetical protein [Solirubrobacteraceae bacterium]